jgi:hypothetical protein
VRRPSARIGAGVSPPRRDDPTAALNQVLSEVIDAVLDVKQAHRRVPETHALHAVLDQLFDDLRTWARLLADQEQALGVSPLASMPSAAGFWPGPLPAGGPVSGVRGGPVPAEHAAGGGLRPEDILRVTGKDPVEVTAADVFEFLAHQRGD